MYAISGIWQSMVDADRGATLFINSLHLPFTDNIWMFFSDRFVWIPLYLAITGLIVVKAGWRRFLTIMISIALIILLCDQLSNLVKNIVDRYRPCWDEEMLKGGIRVLEKRGGKFGFFSAHAANSFGIAYGSTAAFRSVRAMGIFRIFSPCIYSWASLVSISRVFVGKHFLGDVFVGILVGIAIAFAIITAERFLWKKWFKGQEEPSPSPGSESL